MKTLTIAAALAATTMLAAPATAQVKFIVEGGATPFIYQDTSTGNYFGVIGVSGRSGNVSTTITEQFVFDSITSGQSSFVGAYSCTGFDATPSCSTFAPFDVTGTNRSYASILVEFSSAGNKIFNTGFGGTSTLNLSATAPLGAPPFAGAVPEPTTWALLIVGMGVAGAAMRRRNAVVRIAYT